MKKITMIAAVAAVMMLPGAAPAQVTAGNTNVNCSLADLTNVTVTRCSGFWSGNRLNRNAGQLTDADETLGLAGLGLTPLTVVQKIEGVGGTAFVNFTPVLYGVTAIAIHWGNGADRFKDAEPDYNGNGGGTSFYLFDAGADGLDVVNFTASLSRSSSGATLYTTGIDVGGVQGTVVPEPSTYALMAAGLAVLGVIARRRRNA